MTPSRPPARPRRRPALRSLPVLLAGVAVAAPHGDAPEPPTWSADVRPILAESCFLCHGPDPEGRRAGLRLDTAEGLAADVDGAPLVAPGDPAGSLLWRRVTAQDDERMPPAGHADALAPDALDVLRRWIEAGAEWQPHWAFAPFRDVTPPDVEGGWARNAIDRFVQARLEREGLRPAPEADRRTLIRRVSLDLVGMVPTPEEVEAFVADDRPDAWERLVDRLLASPHWAEAQARDWLDLARYADSHGFTIDGARSMWPWRDWVVRALDADVPFDRFTVEQLAGDLLPDATVDQVVATGFHRNTQVNQEGGAKDEENRVNAVLDRVNTTGAVWLGATVDCAQCHDHKFDPVTQREYFRLFAFFNTTADGGVHAGPSVAVPDEATAPALRAFETERARLAAALAAARADAARGWTAWRPARATGENGPELVLQPDDSIRVVAHRPETSVYALDGPPPAAGPGGAATALRLEALPDTGLPAGGPGRAGNGNFVLSRVRVLHRAATDGAWREIALADAAADFEQDTAADGGGRYPASGALSDEPGTGWAVKPAFGEPHAAHFALAEPLPAGGELRVELHQTHGDAHTLGRFRVAFGAPADLAVTVPEAWRAAWRAAREHEATRPDLPTVLVMRERTPPRVTRVFRRGSFLDPGEVVTPGYPAALNHFAPDAPAASRLDLARWLVHPENALVWRVTVNRAWQRFFGLGLVATENDFGLRGARPSHPDLLEWLARDFVRSGTSLKELHRTIVTSAAYRQGSRPRADLAERDPQNRLLARQARLRLPAEAIRDSALRASGLFDPRVGGPPVQPPQPDGVFAFTQNDKGWRPSEGGDRYRRSLYTRHWRSSAFPFYTTFDAPPANVTCTRRQRSITPLQALALANDPMMVEIAAGLAARVRAERATDEARLDRLFELVLARPPSADERAVLAEHLAAQRARHAAAGRGPDDAEERAWTSLARVALNLDEFVTRE